MAPANAMILCNEACRNDDVSLMDQAILVALQAESRHAVEDIIQRGLRRSAARGSVDVLRYVLDHDADVDKLIAKDIMIDDEPLKPSIEVLEMLLAHGWDVNNRGDGRPLLWFVVAYPDLVEWCMDHGANIDVPDPALRLHPDGSEGRLSRPRPTILGAAASSGSIDTFELLREKGAALDRRTLHMAVEKGRDASSERKQRLFAAVQRPLRNGATSCQCR
ncbi:Putative ankyrin repeat-containing domain superfamily [Septoria linicola]|uniref:Ankyrin repeat-containing domain superfamily n=1 Tax=Septoria linicola TaxID=215465 RepID=A0A9Q9EF72_9PEZI|nr:Putative ankyrin repeat-containing domain superfamily [Septoria linicola]